MARAEVMYHKGRRIARIDLAKATTADVIQACTEAAPLIQNQPEKSVFCWVDTEGTMMTKEISEALKMFTLKNKPFVRMTAITGIGGVQKVVLSAILIFTKRDNLVVKNSKDEALDFLASISMETAAKT